METIIGAVRRPDLGGWIRIIESENEQGIISRYSDERTVYGSRKEAAESDSIKRAKLLYKDATGIDRGATNPVQRLASLLEKGEYSLEVNRDRFWNTRRNRTENEKKAVVICQTNSRTAGYIERVVWAVPA